MRLDKCMEVAKIGSRKQVKKLFKAQQIWIDDQPAHSLSQIVDPALQEIVVQGKQMALAVAIIFFTSRPE